MTQQQPPADPGGPGRFDPAAAGLRPPPPAAPPPQYGCIVSEPFQPPQQTPPPVGPPPRHERLAWQPAPPEPGPGVALRVGMLATAVLVVAALVTVGILVTQRSTGTPVAPVATPTTVAPTPTLTTTPTPEPSPEPSPQGSGPAVTVPPAPGGRAWHLPEQEWPPLPPADPQSPLYPAQVTALEGLPPVTLTGCPSPATVSTEEQWRTAVRAQWSCLHAAWVPVFEQLGWPTTEPEVLFYPGEGSKSDCGYLTAPAFYCSAGAGSVYFGGEHLAMARTWDLSVNEMVNHEYGHHLQNLAGVTGLKLGLPVSNENERRAELQATCLSALQTYHNRSFEFGEDDLASWQRRLESMSVDSIHGTRESLRYWGTRGLYAESIGDCNTWVTGPDDVA